METDYAWFTANQRLKENKAAFKELAELGTQIDYLVDSNPETKKIWEGIGVNVQDKNMAIIYSYVSVSWPSTKEILDKYHIEYNELEDPNSAGESYLIFKIQ